MDDFNLPEKDVMELNSKQKGNITEVAVMLAFLKQGINVLSTYGDCERYDFVIEPKQNLFIKIQVKTCHKTENGTITFNARSNHFKEGKRVYSTYSKDETDYFATVYDGQCYLVPVSEVGTQCSLRLEPTKNNNKVNIKWAKDYQMEEILGKLL